jgi:dCTP deaminase
MAVLSDSQVLTAMNSGRIIISPFTRSHLSNCSYDVTLGAEFYRANTEVKILNPWSKTHIDAFWGDLQTASVATEVEAKDLGLQVGDKYICLRPGEMILGHTQEFIGGLGDITTMMKARSSIGRCCLSVCKCAGMGDIGYISRWTMEITNHSTTASIILPVGKRIAQIVFLTSSEPEKSYAGNYQTGTTTQEIMAAWQPSDMLPKLYKEKVPGL